MQAKFLKLNKMKRKTKPIYRILNIPLHMKQTNILLSVVIWKIMIILIMFIRVIIRILIRGIL